MGKNGWLIKVLTILAAVLGLGFLPVSNPFGNIQELRFSVCSVLTLVSLFQLGYPVLHMFYRLEELLSAAGGIEPTDQFMILKIVPAGCFSGAVNRLGAICNCGKTVKLMRDAMEMKRQMASVVFQRQRSKWTYRFFVFACTAWILAFPVQATINLAMVVTVTGLTQAVWLLTVFQRANFSENIGGLLCYCWLSLESLPKTR